MNSNMVTTIAFSALKQLGLVHSPEEWNQMLNEIDPDRSKGYANMNLSDALKLIQAKGGDLSKIDFAKLGEEVNMQMDYGKMMDAVRAQQAQQIMQQQGLPVSGPVSQNGFPEMLDNFFNRPEFSIVGGLEASEGNSTAPRGPGFFTRLWSAMKANPVAALGVIFGGPAGAVLGTNYLAGMAMAGGNAIQPEMGKATSTAPVVNPLTADQDQWLPDIGVDFPWVRGPALHSAQIGHTMWAYDMGVPSGTEYHAVFPGFASRNLRDPNGYGNLVTVNHGFGVETWYAHNSEFLIPEEGKQVDATTPIAKSGYTGAVIPAGPAGAHSHFELHIYGTSVDASAFRWDEFGQKGQVYVDQYWKEYGPGKNFDNPAWKIR